MSDRGPDEVKSRIGGLLEKFLDDNDDETDVANTDAPKPAAEPGTLSAAVNNLTADAAHPPK
jgi:hypothetical protein